MQCPRCNGTGDCAECSGSGSVTCPACDGAGTRITERGMSYKCKSCGGKGTVECAIHCSSCAGSGVITEELQKETREKYRMRFVNYTPSGKTVVPLILLNAAVYLILEVKPEWGYYLALSRDTFQHHYYWALLTPEFMHAGLFHLILNMSFLYTWGQVTEGLLGKQRFLTLYLVSGLCASLASYYGNVVIDGGYFAGIGASGALYGLIGAMGTIHLRWRMVPPSELRKLATMAFLLIVVGFALRGSAFDLLDNWGHIGGLISGFLIMWLMPRPGGR